MKQIFMKIFIYHLLIERTASWRPFVFEINNFTTESMSKVIDMNSTISKDQVLIYANIRDNLPNLHLKVVLIFESANNVYDMEFINRTIDLCEFFRNRRYEPVLQIFYKIFSSKDQRFMIRSCPIKKNVYYTKNTVLDAESFPPVMPNKKGFFDAYLMVKYAREMKPICHIVFYFQFKNQNN